MWIQGLNFLSFNFRVFEQFKEMRNTKFIILSSTGNPNKHDIGFVNEYFDVLIY